MEYLALTLLATRQTEIINELYKLASQCGCYVLESRATPLGPELAINLLLKGRWNTIAKFEASFTGLEQKYDLRSHMRRTKPIKPEGDQIPYQISVISPEQPDAVTKIIQFFMDRALTIYDLHSMAYKALITEAAMLEMTLRIQVPKNSLVADIREEFMIFCDGHNFDAIMEPYKDS